MTFKECRQKMESLRDLPEGWDTYGAPQISPVAIESALEVVRLIEMLGGRAPNPVPCPTGGVALAPPGDHDDFGIEADGRVELDEDEP